MKGQTAELSRKEGGDLRLTQPGWARWLCETKGLTLVLKESDFTLEAVAVIRGFLFFVFLFSVKDRLGGKSP